MACNFTKKKTPTHMFSCKCLRKTFYGTPPVAASENGSEELLRIFKGSLTWNDLYNLTNLNM